MTNKKIWHPCRVSGTPALSSSRKSPDCVSESDFRPTDTATKRKSRGLTGLLLPCLLLLAGACNQTGTVYDAGGTLEAVTVTVSATGNGPILWLRGEEGETVQKGEVLGCTDTIQFYLQKRALLAGAGGRKVSEKIDANSSPLDIQAAQIQDMLDKCRIVSPIAGTILERYTQAGEIAYTGKPVFKLANLDTMILKAYVTAGQLSRLKLNQEVRVFALKDEETAAYSGRLMHISEQAEFSPKSIQTQNERANLVYAVKIAVKNDGFLKIGMHADVIF